MNMLGLVLVLVAIGTVRAAGVYFSGEPPCPALCNAVGPNPDNWTVYHSVERLRLCDSNIILTFAVFNPLDDPNTAVSLRTCSLDSGSSGIHDATTISSPLASRHDGLSRSNSRVFGRQSENSTQPAGIQKQAQAAWKTSSQGSSGVDVVSQAKQFKEFLESENAISSSLGPTLFFIHHPNTSTSIGIYAGTGIPTAPLIETFVDFIESHGYSGDALIQACGEVLEVNGTGATAVPAAVGIVASTGLPSLVAAQRAVREWANSTCVSAGYESSSNVPTRLQTVAISSESFLSGSLQKRDTCKTVTVVSGNLCADLAKECGISVTDLLNYNSQDNFCATLKVPQLVCCTAGDLPIPKPDGGGNCATYKVVSGDSCWGITNSLSNLISADDLEKYNKNTWGWGGCNNLQASTIICLSSGYPPLPLPVTNAVCGPIKPGTVAPPAGTNLSSLNPCPINACCDVWGFCGTTDEFCRPIPAGQAPGAPQPLGGPNCVSNCGTDIVNNGAPPLATFNIGYFEGYGMTRSCNQVDIRTIDLKKYTHIHFAFATVDADTFAVNMGPTINQFYYFKQLTGVKKILSFGGWTFSTDPATYGIFRTGVTGANRQVMAQNIANFVISNNLDGVDVDWEYPAAPDLPDIPSADPAEGLNYLKFLTTLKGLLPAGKTVSFAAPASYWYLQGFPVDRIIKVVDYVVFMTYDLHGQWDYNNKWSDPGCDGGNCLRSHVNMTETMNALSMITKAGAASNKVVVGVTSYGRSFQMTTAGCTGPMCTYTGPSSGATPGKCTQTAGYIGMSEIRDILKNNPSASTYLDTNTSSNILVYDSTQWVAYMDDDNKKARQQKFKNLNFLGTSDWAISLDNIGLVAPVGDSLGDNETFPVPQYAVDPQIHSSCVPYKDIILEAWSEAGDITKGPLKWSRWNKYQGALDNYVGPKSGQVPWFNDEIWYNFKRHNAFHYGGDMSPTFVYSYYYCDVDQMPEKVQKGIIRAPCPYNAVKRSGTAAITYRYPGTFSSTYYTLLCPWWLGQIDGAPKWSSLKNIANEGDSFDPLKKQIDRWANTVRAVTIHHETTHWQDISWPHCDKRETYAPEQIVAKAQHGGDTGYEYNLRNAHSWTLTATSMWMMQRWPDIGVPMPARPIPTSAATWDADDDPDGTDDDDGVPTDDLDAEWFDPSQVNPADFTKLSHYAPIEDGNLGDCTEGQYEFQDQCLMNCDLGDEGRDCTQNDDKTWQCTGCDKEPTACVAGLHPSWDDCYSNCLNGLCSENAGENGIRCTC